MWLGQHTESIIVVLLLGIEMLAILRLNLVFTRVTQEAANAARVDRVGMRLSPSCSTSQSPLSGYAMVRTACLDYLRKRNESNPQRWES